MRRLATRTFRWNDGTSTDGYEAVEVEAGGLRWFRWSHVHGAGGRSELGVQSFATFLAEGPPLAVPRHVLAELERLAQTELADDARD